MPIMRADLTSSPSEEAEIEVELSEYPDWDDDSNHEDDIDDECDCDECIRARRRRGVYDGDADDLRFPYNADATRHLEFKVGKYERFSRTLPFLGVELEVYARDSVAPREAMQRTLKALNGFAILKRDGSLDSYRGFEIVSAPATFAAHRERWRPFFEGDAAPANLCRSFSTEACGMHVHINRAAMSHFHIVKMDVFINSAINRDFIFGCADRTYAQMAQWSALKHIEGAPFSSSSRDVRRPHTKYLALNLLPPDTIELRIFRGNVKPFGFWKNLEFTQAAFDFTAQASARQLHWRPFVRWVHRHGSKKYAHLRTYLTQKGYHATV